MTSEFIVPSRYILTRDAEIGSFAGVAYKRLDGSIKNELLWGTNKFLSVQMVGQSDENGIFVMYHIFVERYIDKCLRIPFNDVDIYRFYLSRGDFPEEPSDIRGEVSNHFYDAEMGGKDVWTSYEHISGPFLADPQYITSQFTAGRLDDISPNVTQALILDKEAYRRNPQDLPMLGVILGEDQVSTDQRFLEDLVIRLRAKKTSYIN